jgi:lipopolysaccharide transport system ATP-binding protein
VLFVSHNMSAVRNLCGRGLLLVQGQKHFDGSAERTIMEYSSSTPKDSRLSWNRPDDLSRNGIAFETIHATLLGQQPQLRLKCNVVLQADDNGEAVFIAVDICDQLQTPIMQALPFAAPFISGRAGRQHLSLEIDLPPLIPGHYFLDFWIGSHFSSTVDYVKNVVTFEIVDGPSPDRSFPYSPGHGFLVPASRCEFLPV